MSQVEIFANAVCTEMVKVRTSTEVAIRALEMSVDEGAADISKKITVMEVNVNRKVDQLTQTMCMCFMGFAAVLAMQSAMLWTMWCNGHGTNDPCPAHRSDVVDAVLWVCDQVFQHPGAE